MSLACVFRPAGHLSYRQMEAVREVLRRVGTWDLLQLHCGEQLKGDYQGCQYIALNRQETCTLEFSRVRTLSTYTVWALLGHTPQVSPLTSEIRSSDFWFVTVPLFIQQVAVVPQPPQSVSVKSSSKTV